MAGELLRGKAADRQGGLSRRDPRRLGPTLGNDGTRKRSSGTTRNLRLSPADARRLRCLVRRSRRSTAKPEKRRFLRSAQFRDPGFSVTTFLDVERWYRLLTPLRRHFPSALDDAALEAKPQEGAETNGGRKRTRQDSTMASRPVIAPRNAGCERNVFSTLTTTDATASSGSWSTIIPAN